MRRKALGGLAIVLIFSASLLGFFSLKIVDWKYNIGVSKRADREKIFIRDVELFEGVKSSMRDALFFSTYSASKEIFDNEGVCESGASECLDSCGPSKGDIEWRRYSTTNAPSKEEFEQSLGKLILYGVNEYASYFDFMPDFCSSSGISLDQNGNGMEVDVYAGSKGNPTRIIYTGGFFELSDYARFTETVNAKTLDIFDASHSKFIEGDIIKQSFNDAENSLPEGCRENNFNSVGETGDGICEEDIEGKCVELFQSSCNVEDPDKEFADYFSNEIESATSGYNDVSMSFDRECLITGSRINYEKAGGEESSDCKCLEWETVCVNPDVACGGMDYDECKSSDDCRPRGYSCQGGSECLGKSYENCPEGCDWSGGTCECKTKEECVRRAKKYDSVTCHYDYFGSASFLVEVKDETRKYPIGNSLDNISLRFKATSGNVPASVEDCDNPVEEGSVCC